MVGAGTEPGCTRSRRASVLVIVMVTLIFTATALVLFVEQASTDLLVETREATARRLRRDAYSTLESVLATLEDFRRAGGLHSPAEGWGDPLKFSGWEPRSGVKAEVSLVDESGKLSLSHVDAATLTNLFKAWDLKQADAERLTDVLLGWMQKDHVSTSAVSTKYDAGALPYEVPARPLRSFSELAAIEFARDVFYDEQGRPTDLWRRFAATFSLYNYQQLNLNAAPSDVLSAIGFPDPTQQNRLKDFLSGTGGYTAQGPGWLTSTAQAGGIMGTPTIPSGNVGTQVRALRVNVVVHEGQAQFRVSAVVAPSGGAAIVQTTATAARPTTSATATSPATAAPAPSAATPANSTSAAAAAPQLNYPFTLLEITENAEISTPPPPPSA